MSGFGAALTHIMFWSASIFISLLLVAFSIKILGPEFVRNMFRSKAVRLHEGHPDPSGEA
jgi:hypothetical protein